MGKNILLGWPIQSSETLLGNLHVGTANGSYIIVPYACMWCVVFNWPY